MGALVPQLRLLSTNEEDAGIPVARIRNEGDARWLEILRHVLLFAKLLGKRRGLVVTTPGRELMDDARAGALYAVLFRTFLRRFDLQFLHSGSPYAALKTTLAYSFHQLRRVGDAWTSDQQLAASAWLDSARDPMDAWDVQFGDRRHAAFRYRVLELLVKFGLLERRRDVFLMR